MTMKTLDLRIGDPVYMKEYWELIDKLYSSQVGRSSIGISEMMSYDYEQEDGYLKDQIVMLHKMVGNAETFGYEIVLGNGISQLISAMSYAFRLKHANRAYAQSPHWNRFEFLCKLGAQAAHPHKFSFHEFSPKETTHSSFTETTDTRKTFEIITLPNNPDNSINDKKSLCSFVAHDLCYYWPQYTRITKRSDDLMMFGLSKATGHAGSRIGWALVKDRDIASSMKKYITLSTSGVSLDAQHRAVEIIHSINVLRQKEMMSPFDCGKRELDKRWFDFLFATANNSNFKVLNSSGMFAWCDLTMKSNPKETAADAFAKKYNILALAGSTFGNVNGDADKFRINIACSKEDFTELISRIQNVK